MKSKGKITLKERKLLKGIAEGKTKKQAAIEAGYSGKSADQRAYQTLRKPSVQSEFQKILEAAGVTRTAIAAKIAQGMEATKVISATIVAGSSNEAGSQTNDFIEVPDFQSQHKFLETAVRLSGLNPAEKQEVTHVHTFEQRMKAIHEGSPDIGDEEEVIEIEKV